MNGWILLAHIPRDGLPRLQRDWRGGRTAIHGQGRHVQTTKLQREGISGIGGECEGP